jgi:hypothetical protein
MGGDFMINEVKISLRREIDRLTRAVSQKTVELKSLSEELKRCKGALGLLGNGARGGARTRQRKRAKAGKSALVDWNLVFGRLPKSFTLKEFTRRSEIKGKSPVYLRKIAANWVKQGRTKRIRLGEYQKVEQKKARTA